MFEPKLVYLFDPNNEGIVNGFKIFLDNSEYSKFIKPIATRYGVFDLEIPLLGEVILNKLEEVLNNSISTNGITLDACLALIDEFQRLDLINPSIRPFIKELTIMWTLDESNVIDSLRIVDTDTVKQISASPEYENVFLRMLPKLEPSPYDTLKSITCLIESITRNKYIKGIRSTVVKDYITSLVQIGFINGRKVYKKLFD